jgi:hypothetical protein
MMWEDNHERGLISKDYPDIRLDTPCKTAEGLRIADSRAEIRKL